MIKVYTTEAIPITINQSIFLAGPTLRQKQLDQGLVSWREKAIAILELLDYKGVVFIPEPNPESNFKFEELEYDQIHQWETKCLNIADRIIFWINRDLDNGILGLTTNNEFGQWMQSGKCVLGTEIEADSVRYQEHWAKELNIKTFHNLYEILKWTIVIDQPNERTDGERFVPLLVWNTQQFQNWYSDLKLAGNHLQSAKVLSIHQASNGFVFAFTLWANIYITSENRYKNNEFIFSRTDIAACVLYYPRLDPMQSEIIIVSEFRTPVSNKKGLVYELPGGSSSKPNQDPIQTMIDEVNEETGFKMNPDKIHKVGQHQLCATLLTHKASVWSYKLDRYELDQFYQKRGIAFGNHEEGEMCHVHVYKLQNIIDSELVDWSNIGMIMKAVMQ